MRSVLLCLLVASGCARAAGNHGEPVDGQPFAGDDATDGRGSSDGPTDASTNGTHDGGGGDGAVATDASTAFDASITNDASATSDATSSGAVLSQYSSRSCWSWGGFGTVRPDAPAHVLGFLEDPDGVTDIAGVAEVIITGSGAHFSLGLRALETLDETGCCRRATKVPITYADFIAAAQVIDTDTTWGARVVYRDLGGHTTTAVCDGAAGWRLNSTPIGT